MNKKLRHKLLYSICLIGVCFLNLHGACFSTKSKNMPDKTDTKTNKTSLNFGGFDELSIHEFLMYALKLKDEKHFKTTLFLVLKNNKQECIASILYNTDSLLHKAIEIEQYASFELMLKMIADAKKGLTEYELSQFQTDFYEILSFSNKKIPLTLIANRKYEQLKIALTMLKKEKLHELLLDQNATIFVKALEKSDVSKLDYMSKVLNKTDFKTILHSNPTLLENALERAKQGTWSVSGKWNNFVEIFKLFDPKDIAKLDSSNNPTLLHKALSASMPINLLIKLLKSKHKKTGKSYIDCIDKSYLNLTATTEKRTAMHLALLPNIYNSSEAIKIIKFLKEQGGNLLAKDKQGNTVVTFAVLYKRAKLLQELLKLIEEDKNIDNQSSLSWNLFNIILGGQSVSQIVKEKICTTMHIESKKVKITKILLQKFQKYRISQAEDPSMLRKLKNHFKDNTDIQKAIEAYES